MSRMHFLILIYLAVLGLCCCVWPFSGCGKWGLLTSCGAWASHCGDLSCCGVQALDSSGFSSCGPQAQYCGSEALKYKLNSCGAQAQFLCTMGIFPDQGSNLCLTHWQADY